MLVMTSESSLSDTDKFAATILNRRIAVDVETGAYLMPSHGRSRYAPKYFLILPNKDSFERSIIRAWSDEEALIIGNQRLPNLLKRSQKR